MGTVTGPVDPIQIDDSTRFGLASDERLARQAARGDRAAFGALYERYSPELYRYCSAIVRDSDDAADALQSTMLSALHAIQGERRQMSIKPWLYRIAHNESISLLRRRRPTVGLDAAAGVCGGDVDEDAAGRERLRQLVADLRGLTERQRGALVMRELGGIEYADIATVFNTTLDGAKRSVHDARVALVDVADGRELECSAVRAVIADRDGRALRGRRIRSHLAECTSCTAFRSSLDALPADLMAIFPPLPLATAAFILKGALAGAGAGGVGKASGGLAALIGGQSVGGASVASGGVAAMVVAATIGVGGVALIETRDRGGDRDSSRSAQSQDSGHAAARRAAGGSPGNGARIASVAAYEQPPTSTGRDRHRSTDRQRTDGAFARAESTERSAPARRPAEPAAAYEDPDQEQPRRQRERDEQPSSDDDGSDRSQGGGAGAQGPTHSGNGSSGSGSSREAAGRLADEIAALVEDYTSTALGSGSLRPGQIDRIVAESLNLADAYGTEITSGFFDGELGSLIDTYAGGGGGGSNFGGSFERQLQDLLSGLPGFSGK